MKPYVILEKKVGETPLQCVEVWRAAQPPAYERVPLAYAGRLDPMASGQLLILIGEECKVQANYHSLDKEYEFTILLGTSSDSGDVLGLVSPAPQTAPISKKALRKIARDLTGAIELPYPHYSSKTVQGKPLHTWAIEGRLDEITIPTKKSHIYSLTLTKLETKPAETVVAEALEKVNSLPPVTELRKAIGNDFRRVDVRASWALWQKENAGRNCQLATFRCTASSGTYMRTLAEVVAKKAETTGLAFLIHRSKIGVYQPLPLRLSFWRRQFR